MVVALIDSMPSQEYGKDIEAEIGRLESVGESIMDFIFIVYAITQKNNWNLHFRDIENYRIQTFKNCSLIEKSKYYLDDKVLTNQRVLSDAPKRELCSIVKSIVGALGLCAGIEPVIKFLYLIDLIEQDKNQSQEFKQKSKGYQIREEEKKEETSQSLNLDSTRLILQGGQKFSHKTQGLQFLQQIKKYFENFQENQQDFEKLFKQNTLQIEKIKKQVILVLNKQNSLDLSQDIIQILSFFDRSYNDYKIEDGFNNNGSFIQENCCNQKLKIIGQRFIAMTFKIRIYQETSGLFNIEQKSNQKFEECISQIMLASWHCYAFYTKFLKNSSLTDSNLPLIISKNSQLSKKTINYQKLIQSSIIPLLTDENEQLFLKYQDSEQFKNIQLTASTNQSTNHISETSIQNLSNNFELIDENNNFLTQIFTLKPQEKMKEIAENFIPEYANALCALIGARFISTKANFQETNEFVQNLLMKTDQPQFPILSKIQILSQNFWNACPFSKSENLLYQVEEKYYQQKDGQMKKFKRYLVFIKGKEMFKIKIELIKCQQNNELIYEIVQELIGSGNKFLELHQKIIKFEISPDKYYHFIIEFSKIFEKIGYQEEHKRKEQMEQKLFLEMVKFYSNKKIAKQNQNKSIQSQNIDIQAKT